MNPSPQQMRTIERKERIHMTTYNKIAEAIDGMDVKDAIEALQNAIDAFKKVPACKHEKWVIMNDAELDDHVTVEQVGGIMVRDLDGGNTDFVECEDDAGYEREAEIWLEGGDYPDIAKDITCRAAYWRRCVILDLENGSRKEIRIDEGAAETVIEAGRD